MRDGALAAFAARRTASCTYTQTQCANFQVSGSLAAAHAAFHLLSIIIVEPASSGGGLLADGVRPSAEEVAYPAPVVVSSIDSSL